MIELEVKLYESVINSGLGRAHLLKKKENKYLFYLEENGEHYCVCNCVYGDKDGCSFDNNEYFSKLESALKYFEVK